ncbi:MAG TPA: DUF4407 domain-containing protein [Pyrinomonadaceae bacterium]|nr:DUF4407 domain-containing protein [Pyrinomonadaceae bacterium]
MTLIRDFFIFCSGADLTILRRPECATERSKYAAVGIAVFLASALAALSGGYALSSVLQSTALSAGFGILWGVFIFNLNRSLFSIITKKAVPRGAPLRDRLPSLLSTPAALVARLLLAFFISFVVARPIELKLFESTMEYQLAESITLQANEDISILTAEINELVRQLDSKNTEVLALSQMHASEVAGARGASTTGRTGRGPAALQMAREYRDARADMERLLADSMPRIETNRKKILDLEQQRELSKSQVSTVIKNSLWARLAAFDRLMDSNPTVRLANYAILTFFLLLLSIPMLLRLMWADKIYETLRQSPLRLAGRGEAASGEERHDSGARAEVGGAVASAQAVPGDASARPATRDPYRLVGNVFAGKYRLDEYAGGGGMGAVYRSTRVDSHARVAVKIFKPDILAMHPDYAVLFEREVTAARRMRHPNIVEVIDNGTTDDGISFMVMEWLTGETLGHVLERGQLPLDRVTHIFGQICDAVSYAHGNGIIHLDIKPGNIFLVGSGPEGDRIKVIDFGMARVLSSDTGTTVTRFLGTYQYCSPEHFGGKVNSRSDVYSLGATLYHMLAGTLPFGASYVNAKAHPNLELPPVPSLLRMRPGLPKEVDEVLRKALSKSPEERQASAQQLSDDFSRACRCALSV